MDWLEAGDVAARVGLALAALAAWHVVEPCCVPTFRPVTLALSAAFAADQVRAHLKFFVLEPARSAGRLPYTGIERVAFHVDAALWIGFYGLSVALAAAVFLRRWSRPVVGVVAVLTAALVLAQVVLYPGLRGKELLDDYHRLHVASAVAQALTVAVFIAGRNVLGPSQRVALLLLGSDIAALFGPWLAGDPVRDWYTSRWPSAVTWTVVSLYEWSVWCRRNARRQAAGSLP